MDQVWTLELQPEDKLLLLAFAWHVNAADEEGNAWPGVARVAKMCGMSERTARRRITALLEAGVLVAVTDRTGGRARSTVYQINPGAAADARNQDTAMSGYSAQKADTAMSGYSPEKADTAVSAFREKTRTKRAETRTEKAETRSSGAQNPDTAVSGESLRTGHESESEPIEIDDDVLLTDYERQIAPATAAQRVELCKLLARLRAHGSVEWWHLALRETSGRGKGFLYFRAVVLNALRDGVAPGSARPQPTNGNGAWHGNGRNTPGLAAMGTPAETPEMRAARYG
jgi:hypothetical protein